MRVFLTFLSLLLLAASAWAQGPVVSQLIDPVSLDSDGTTLTIVFDDLEQNDTTNFEAQHSDNVTNWAGIPTGTVTPHASIAHRYTLTANDPGSERKFYRILAYSTTAEDSDGDGLSDEFEASLFTDPNKADTDGDGFTDGIEFASGIDPLNPASKPNDGLPPIVQFDASTIEASEGAPTNIQFSFDRPYSGTVTYNVIDRSSAISPRDYAALSGSVSVNGLTGSIPITWVDDLDVQRTRLLFIQLIEPAGSAYIPGGKDFIGVRLMDNDAWWSGSLGGPPEIAGEGSSSIARDFRIKLARNVSGPVATFGAGAGMDGIPLLEGEAVGLSQSEGVIPSGLWPASTTVHSTTDFEVQSPDIQLPTQEGLFGSLTDLVRTLRLDATPGEQAMNQVSDTLISGHWEEEVTSVSSPHMNRTLNGIFILAKDIPQLAPLPDQS